MIQSFRNKGLQHFWEQSDVERIPTDWARRIAHVLDILDAAAIPEDVAIPGQGFHACPEGGEARFGVMVSQAWRLSFAWDKGDAVNIDLEEIR